MVPPVHSERPGLRFRLGVGMATGATMAGLRAGLWVTGLVLLFSDPLQCAARAAESPLSRYLGAASCASSSCHGGAGETRDAWVRWNSADVHRRAAATLGTARSTQIARAAGLGEPAQQARCTVCHSPFAQVPEQARVGSLDSAEGVSCESCHGPAERWLRSHTRTDFSLADRTAEGLRPLADLYVRANTCVACHENVDNDLLEAGHPELRFELDGQTMAEPRHWREDSAYNGAQAWLVGQIVAARELSWQEAKSQPVPPRLAARAAAARWLVGRAAGVAGLGPSSASSDAQARAAANLAWNPGMTSSLLRVLAGSAAEFRSPGPSREEQARRAERLVLALDRLLAASPSDLEKRLTPSLNLLFERAQSVSAFDPGRFAEALDRFAAQLSSP